jgi:kynureninase
VNAAALAAHYTRFGVAERLLLTGHSHQAWPDVALEGQVAAFDDAALLADEKWERALAQADRVRDGLRGWLADPDAELALGASTHDLVLRFLSALDLAARPRLVTTDGEFHTLRRQLGRLAEGPLEVVRVAARPAESLAERLAAEIDDRTAAVLVSAVLFEDARVVGGLDGLAAAAAERGTELLIDVYHALGTVPFAAPRSAWVTGGGYKYLQLGEGACFLRLPEHAYGLRPAITGWYAEFGALADPPRPGQVAYPRGAGAFAGSTYDPTSHYRAARVIRFFGEQGLTPPVLHASYRRQVASLATAFDALDLDPGVIARAADPGAVAGFLALRSPHAGELQRALAAQGVLTDSRGGVLRLGPAPYLTDAQLEEAVRLVGVVARGFGPG